MEEIYESIWALSPHLHDRASYAELRKLTRKLIESYDLDGRLNEHPFSAARERKLSLPFEKIHEELKGSVCLVTGGLGCVGSTLVKELLRFDVKRIVIVDKQKVSEVSTASFESNVIHLTCDILNSQALEEAFSTHRPDFVFHTAAQRNPGYAETHVVDTVQTNILGTLNVVKACEALNTVKQCVFSSTGKASRYFTQEIYAATKKICEYILDTYARKSSVKYSMIRFTHILDNSLMDVELKHASSTDYVAVHSPGKFVTAQNVKEAAHLMLNALIYSENKQCKLLLVRNLEWPVESLQMALYHIKNSGRDIPIIFKGNPNGYIEELFRGQLDWSDPTELNLLVNVYESRQKSYNQEEDIIISRICPSTASALEQTLYYVQIAEGEEETKKYLIAGLELLVKETLKVVPKEETIAILRWGLQPPWSKKNAVRISDYGKMISLLLESLEGSEYLKKANRLLGASKIESY